MNYDHFMPHTPEDIREMLAAIGVASIDDLFAPIPSALRAQSFDLPAGMSEFEMLKGLKTLAGKNAQEMVNFVGGGFYDHLIPATVDHLSGRAEFYTAYTPYQPECSQGTLQALFEYQTAICRLTGLEVSNASLYDGATAMAEAALMMLRITERPKVVMDEAVNPIYRDVVRSYLKTINLQLVEVPQKNGTIDRDAFLAAIDDDTAGILLQNPNFFGTADDFTDLITAAHAKGALAAVSVYPVALGMLKSPGEMGADIATGDGQPLGNPLSFGGPSFGFMAARKKYIRNFPGRIIGETIDRNGKRGFVLTLQAREQHIKRHKATSNICSNQSLCALRGLIFLASLGKEGFVELAKLNYDKASYARNALTSIKGASLYSTGSTFNEFTLTLPKPAVAVVETLLKQGIAAGVPAGTFYQGLENQLVVTVTEKRSRDEIDKLAKALEVALWS